MNVTLITGNIGADAEVKQIREDLFAINFSVAVTKRIKDAEDKTTWFKCVWFLKTDNVANLLKKGNVVAIEGEVDLERFKNKDGIDVTNLKLLVKELSFCYTKPSSN